MWRRGKTSISVRSSPLRNGIGAVLPPSRTSRVRTIRIIGTEAVVDDGTRLVVRPRASHGSLGLSLST
jgi:hypothetical protein